MGCRESKYATLSSLSIEFTTFSNIQPEAPFFFFAPKDFGLKVEYNRFLGWDDLFHEFKLGFMSGNDQLLIDTDAGVLRRRIQRVLDPSISEKKAAVEFSIQENYPIGRMRRARFDKRKVIKCGYRPFDERFTYYDDHVMERALYSINRHLMRENLAICVSRQLSRLPYRHVFVTNKVTEMSLVSNKTKEANRVVPLYLYRSEDAAILESVTNEERQPNIKREAMTLVGGILGLRWLEDGQGDLASSIGPESIFFYTYGVLHSPIFRKRYAPFLEIDFPRVPLPGSLDLFRALANLGGELVALHLMESPKLDKHITAFQGDRSREVEKVSYSKETVWIDKILKTGFKGVPEEVWNFHIGGYQVCQKWLKDRKGRTLSEEDITHYHRIVVALKETIRLMAEIDVVIEKHGGWPDAFATSVKKDS